MTQTKAELLETKHQGDIRLSDADSTNYVGFKAPATVGSNLVWTLPATDGSANQFLQTNASGVLGWGTADVSSAMPLTGGTFTGNTIYNDNVKAIFGTAADGIEIFHDGSNSHIKDTGTGNLVLSGSAIQIENAAQSEFIAKFIQDGAVELYHNNVKTFETTATGIAITGAATVSTNLTVTGDLTVSGTTTTINTQTLDVEDKNVVIGKVSTPSDTTADGGGWTLKGATDKTFNWVNATDSWTSSEHIALGDNKRIALGDGTDMKLFHDGSHSYVQDDGTGELRLASDSGIRITKADSETCAFFDPDGGCELYYDNTIKLETINAGIRVTTGNSLYLYDNGSVICGNGNDLQLYHDGSHNYIRGAVAGEDLNIKNNGNFLVTTEQNDNVIRGIKDAQVEIYHDGSKKLETTSGGINVTGAINVNGSALSSAPTITATATGSIAANTAVHVKSDGTVQTAVVTPPTLGSLGTTSSGEDDYPQCTVYKASTDAVLMVFKDAGNGRPTGMVGTISGSTISWGAETELMNGNDYDVEGGLSVVVDPSDGSYVMTYHANSGGNYTRWQIFTVDGTTITNNGSAMGTVDTANNELGMMECTGANTFVITYNDGSQRARKGTRSGNSITWSSETTLYSNDYAQWSHLSGPGKIVMPYSSNGVQVRVLDVAAMSVGSDVEIDTSNANKIDSAACGANNIIVVYRRDSSSYNLYVIAGYMADGDSSVTWGSAVDVGVACDKPVVHYNSSTGNAVVSYSKIVSGSPNGRYVRDISFSGTNNTTCTAGSETTLYYSSSTSTSNVSYNKRNSVHCSENGQDVFIFNISNTGPRYKARTGESSSMNDENFIGFSDGTSYTNGQTATINVVGNTTTQSSLTPGQKYYLNNDGSIGTTKKSITVPAGIALTSTKLLIKG